MQWQCIVPSRTYTAIYRGGWLGGLTRNVGPSRRGSRMYATAPPGAPFGLDGEEAAAEAAAASIIPLHHSPDRSSDTSTSCPHPVFSFASKASATPATSAMLVAWSPAAGGSLGIPTPSSSLAFRISSIPVAALHAVDGGGERAWRWCKVHMRLVPLLCRCCAVVVPLFRRHPWGGTISTSHCSRRATCNVQRATNLIQKDAR